MLGIKQSRDHVTNERLYERVNQVSIREMILERQLKFAGHCIHMPTNESINRFAIYKSKVDHLLDQDSQQGHDRRVSVRSLRNKKYGGEKIYAEQKFCRV